MLDIIEEVFDGAVTYLRIDGQTAEKSRQRNVDYFNDKESAIDCMLLSTKAAGVGLTLNGANRAIIYDPSWNPAEDAQAIDRCYRIGQSKNVTVYRMITCGTVEEKMYEKQGKTLRLQ
jgi:DNA excision repair protein ERCC-6